MDIYLPAAQSINISVLNTTKSVKVTNLEDPAMKDNTHTQLTQSVNAGLSQYHIMYKKCREWDN